MGVERICGIYCIENQINYKKYIGQSIDMESRWKQHKWELNNNSHHNECLQNAWNKYGEENFKFYIIEKCDCNLLDEKEMYYIKLFDTHAHLGDKQGYNLTPGGCGVRCVSEESRQNLRESQKTIPIYQIDLNGSIVNKWQYGARHAATELNISQSCIWSCLHEKRKTYKGYIWIEEKDYINFNISNYINQNTQARKIKQYSMNGELIKIWDSANQIQTILGFDCSGIIKACKRKYKSYKNHIWCYENDDYVNDNFLLELHSKDFINIYDLNDNFIDKLSSTTEVSEKYNLSKSLISQCLNNTISHAKSYKLKYSAG